MRQIYIYINELPEACRKLNAQSFDVLVTNSGNRFATLQINDVRMLVVLTDNHIMWKDLGE